jgi:hypothetical protein
MTTRTDLLNLFKANTGKILHKPVSEPDLHALVGYQVPRCDRIRYQGRYND